MIPLDVPDYIHQSLKADHQAWERFEKLPPSHRREYVRWIDSAKQEATKLRRLKQAIQMLTNGEKLGLK